MGGAVSNKRSFIPVCLLPHEAGYDSLDKWSRIDRLFQRCYDGIVDRKTQNAETKTIRRLDEMYDAYCDIESVNNIWDASTKRCVHDEKLPNPISVMRHMGPFSISVFRSNSDASRDSFLHYLLFRWKHGGSKQMAFKQVLYAERWNDCASAYKARVKKSGCFGEEDILVAVDFIDQFFFNGELFDWLKREQVRLKVKANEQVYRALSFLATTGVEKTDSGFEATLTFSDEHQCVGVGGEGRFTLEMDRSRIGDRVLTAMIVIAHELVHLIMTVMGIDMSFVFDRRLMIMNDDDEQDLAHHGFFHIFANIVFGLPIVDVASIVMNGEIGVDWIPHVRHGGDWIRVVFANDTVADFKVMLNSASLQFELGKRVIPESTRVATTVTANPILNPFHVTINNIFAFAKRQLTLPETGQTNGNGFMTWWNRIAFKNWEALQDWKSWTSDISKEVFLSKPGDIPVIVTSSELLARHLEREGVTSTVTLKAPRRRARKKQSKRQLCHRLKHTRRRRFK